MPSLLRFLAFCGVLAGAGAVGLYVLATHYEPVQQEEVKAVPGVKIRNP
jgi:multisubunit Na+/H+ antiporter MnhB subunit